MLTSCWQFTHEAQLPWTRRILYTLNRLIHRVLRRDVPTRYYRHDSTVDEPLQYLLLEYIGPETGRMLSDTWEEHRHDPRYRKTLFRGIANIILSLAKVPQSRIGSFRFNDDCTITLTNRPLLTADIILESDGNPRSMEPGDTYTCTEPFVSDLISLHDNRLLHDRSAADDESDCRAQMAIRTMLRAISHHFISREFRQGPFLLQFTDFHQSNVFVDRYWNIKCLIDLEWLCALPVESQAVPYWLTGRTIDMLVEDDLADFDVVRQEFMEALESASSRTELAWPLVQIMQRSWQSKAIWFWESLTSVNAAFFLVADHLCPQYSLEINDAFEDTCSRFWCDNSETVVEQKVRAYQSYIDELRDLYRQ